jgi:Spy/CpxP family protein refolding chaperone
MRNLAHAALALMLAATAVTAFAADAPGPQVCRGDARKLCAGAKPGGGGGWREVRECLRSHADKFSAECRGRQS